MAETVEELGRIAPVASTVKLLICDVAEASCFDADDDEQLERLQEQVKALTATFGTRGGTTGELEGVAIALVHLAGWNQLAGIYRVPNAIVAVDPDLAFWRGGGGTSDLARGDAFAAEFLRALAAPWPARTIGTVTTSGRLLFADAWSPADPEARVEVAVTPGRYAVERMRIACPWDPDVDARMGMQAVLVREAFSEM
jgi:hypothetical protein